MHIVIYLSELLELDEDLARLLLDLLDDDPLPCFLFVDESISSPKVVMYSTFPFFLVVSGLGDLLLSSSLLEYRCLDSPPSAYVA